MKSSPTRLNRPDVMARSEALPCQTTPDFKSSSNSQLMFHLVGTPLEVRTICVTLGNFVKFVRAAWSYLELIRVILLRINVVTPLLLCPLGGITRVVVVSIAH